MRVSVDAPIATSNTALPFGETDIVASGGAGATGINERGGIIDDTIITKHADDAFYVVTNAGRRDRDLAWFKQKLEEWNAGEKAKAEGKVEHEVLQDWGLLALQGASPHYLRSTSC